MKIAFFVSQFPSVSETFIVNQVVALKESGHTVHIFSYYRNPGIPVHQKILDHGLLQDTFYLDPVAGSKWEKTRRLLSKVLANSGNTNILRLCKAKFTKASALTVFESIPFLDKPRYDVVHAQFGINGNYVARLKSLGLFKNARFITTFHGYDLNAEYANNNFYTTLFETCDRYTVNSHYSRQKLVKLGCKDRFITVLPVGLDTNRFKRTGTKKNNDGTIRLIFVGRLIKLKGMELLIEICHRLFLQSPAMYRTTIIGDGELLEDIKALIARYRLEAIVTMEGAKSQEEIISFLNEADIFILPGIEWQGNAEAQGLVIQEAQAMELPVIISDAGGMAEGIIDAVTGFVVKENDIDGFVDKIELLAADINLRKEMGAAGRKFVEENYDSNSLNKKLLQLYV
ncbi:MAG: glycosyltransferase [Ferruginibacter sp.]